MQRSLPNGIANGFSNGAGNTGGQGRNFDHILGYQLDDFISDVMAGAPLAFEDHTTQSPSTNVSPSNISQTSQNIPTTQMFTSNNAPTSTNGYSAFGDAMLSNTNMDFEITRNDSPAMTTTNGNINGIINGQGSVENAIMENGEMDWTLWDDMVNQYGIDGNPTNPTTSTGPGPGPGPGPGALGMIHWF